MTFVLAIKKIFVGFAHHIWNMLLDKASSLIQLMSIDHQRFQEFVNQEDMERIKYFIRACRATVIYLI